jgi:hypothetical protein
VKSQAALKAQQFFRGQVANLFFVSIAYGRSLDELGSHLA